jgi:protein-tyrosine phosphatase
MRTPPEKISVLFVCMGNICRSPAAEGVFAEYVRRAGQDAHFHIDSAGTLDEHSGSLPDDRMCMVAALRGYKLQSRARQVTTADLGNFDLVLAMDHNNLDELNQLGGGPRDHIRLFGSFLDQSPGGGAGPAVPDPYYGGMDGFELVLDMIESACPSLLEFCLALRKSHR